LGARNRMETESLKGGGRRRNWVTFLVIHDGLSQGEKVVLPSPAAKSYLAE